MITTRYIRFDYFLVKTLVHNGRHKASNLLNLHDLFLYIKNSDLKETHLNESTFGKVRIHECTYNSQKKLWILQILKLREKNLPGIVNDNTDTYTPIVLTEEEYVGEFITVIYDPKKCLIYTSRNRYSVQPTALSNYFSALYSKIKSIDKLVILEACQEELDYRNTLKGTTIKNIHLSVIRSGEITDTFKGFLPRMIRELGSHYDTRLVKLSLSKGRGRAGLDYDDVVESIDEVMEYCNLKMLKVDFKTTEDTEVEHLDLIKHRLYDLVKIEDSKTNPITHNILCNYMLLHFKEKRELFKDVDEVE